MHLAARTHTSRFLRPGLLGTVGAVILLALSTTATLAQAPQAFELNPGVVVDPGQGRIYTMSPDGGIDAVSIDFGAIDWHSDDAERPIAASNSAILAQVPSDDGTLVVAVLNSAGQLVRTATIDLPDGVLAPVADRLDHRFLIRADAGLGPFFRVEWQSTALPPRGALIEDDLSSPVVRTGSFDVDPTTGVVTGRPDPPAPLNPPAFQVPENERIQASGRQFRSRDGNHILASERGVGNAADTYQWNVYTAAGSLLGDLEVPTSFAPFFVSPADVIFETRPRARRQGGRLVEEPKSIRAVSLSNGAEQWTVPIRDTDYRGPFPP